MKRILIIGCGSIGERHLRCLLRTQRARAAVCEINPGLRERVTCEYSVPGFASSAGAWNGAGFDGVIICSPAHTHVGLALEVLRRNAALLIEKPLSVGFERVEELKAAAARSGTFVGVAYVYHLHPAFLAAREFLRNRPFGPVLQVNVVAGQHFPTFRPAYRDIYYNQHKTGGGAIQDALTHLANAVEWLVGPTEQVFCDAAHQALEGVSVEDTVHVAARNSGTLVSYSLNQFQAPNETTVQIHCQSGSVKIEMHEARWAVFPRLIPAAGKSKELESGKSGGATGWDYRPTPVAHRDDLFIAQAEAFLDGMEGKPTPICTLDEAIQTLAFNVAALQSARTGEVVKVGAKLESAILAR